MKNFSITQWEDIHKNNEWNAILLGNGASIAIHKDFSYQTLHSVAEENGSLKIAAKIFEDFKTKDFEHVLLACRYAERVNSALGNPENQISVAYEEVRKALIEAVHSVHPQHSGITPDLERVGIFASKFKTIVSLNYDLILYWAIMLFNSPEKNNGTWFKDAFLKGGNFETDWCFLRQPRPSVKGATLVFYPHGSLFVARNDNGDESKIAVPKENHKENDLLRSITDKWSSERYVPIFVSEGTSEEKLAAIYRSHYLTHVYERVLPKLGESLVVYGWAFDDRDQHVLDAILKKTEIKRMAVSVFSDYPDADPQEFCCRVDNAVCQYKSLGRTIDVTFFDSKSPDCWNNPSSEGTSA
ncbi:DUF4917 family protein [Verminephrobacter aporrectodeae]|uniref:DUF4917 family protein n=1 Tax=Verminephrobacter aporrectodeae TaxID=1110389 RepID=UPI00224333BC|nr:DUF4917 family protein [Verminephrobacter aporrectodeae]MCW8177533.1 DUF4917 family protein [Verminephrobacter aporrectodeae subsp. tuberculatae]MCW8204971.1 DUF4917 family protein [Verminephrobacter aporrectodeae subsp. tuberculatae]MCW8209150.1 DUF4917 family protein [Verminephrobacter aporrectodeae subsp. tuberculatae]